MREQTIPDMHTHMSEHIRWPPHVPKLAKSLRVKYSRVLRELDLALLLTLSTSTSKSSFFIRSVLAMVKIPSFDDLHCDPKGPKGNAWGLFGNNDLGMLNLLTSEVVKEASKEIQDGVRVSLDWALNMPANPSFDRKPFKVEMVNRTKPGQPLRAVNDDVLTFNTQCSSQWDGFRHYGMPQQTVWMCMTDFCRTSKVNVLLQRL